MLSECLFAQHIRACYILSIYVEENKEMSIRKISCIVGAVLCVLAFNTTNMSENSEITAEARAASIQEVSTATYIANEMNMMSQGLAEESKYERLPFSDTSVKLNSEIYAQVENIMYAGHFETCFVQNNTNLWNSYKENLDPLVFMAIANCETGLWNDTRYTWTPAVYSSLFASIGVDMDRLQIQNVDCDTYVANGLSSYLGCGSNCTAGANTHYHTTGRNDNDSLGPYQILRRYVESSNGKHISYECGETVSDLMRWKDSTEYTYHKAGQYFAYSNWNDSYSISNSYELAMLMGVAHNTGIAYLSGTSAGSYWNDSEAVYAFCRSMASEEAIQRWDALIEDWFYNEVKPNVEAGTKFRMPGQYISESQMNKVITNLGFHKGDFASSFKHKQYYPLRTLLNYMGLEALYSSMWEV